MTSIRVSLRLGVAVLVAVLLAGCARGQVQRPGSANHGGDVEARLRRLEETNVKYAEALEFLGKVYAQQQQQAREAEGNEPAPDAVFAVDIKADLKLGLVNGPATALVTVVKAFDFACPFCERANETLDELVKDYGGKLRVVYKNLVVHPEVATAAHLASCAAAKQGKYLPFKNAVWEQGFSAYAASRDVTKLDEEHLIVIAKGVGLDTARLKKDLAGAECKALVQGDMAELEKFHVT
jgi:protein-disulfide isomerase